jgi:hypothetical protein
VGKAKSVEKEPKANREKANVQPDCDTKKVLLDEMVWIQPSLSRQISHQAKRQS